MNRHVAVWGGWRCVENISVKKVLWNEVGLGQKIGCQLVAWPGNGAEQFVRARLVAVSLGDVKGVTFMSQDGCPCERKKKKILSMPADLKLVKKRMVISGWSVYSKFWDGFHTRSRHRNQESSACKWTCPSMDVPAASSSVRRRVESDCWFSHVSPLSHSVAPDQS